MIPGPNLLAFNLEMNSIKKSILILGIAIIAACAGTGIFSREDVEAIHPGMTEAEVVAILGEPYSRKVEGEKTKLTWSYGGFGAPNVASFLFEGGVVVEQGGRVGK